jgi:hypothetical protein
VHIFLTAFLPQIPIVHMPTLRVELKPPILIQSMQACGALFVKTNVADAFVERTLGTLREKLVQEFVSAYVYVVRCATNRVRRPSRRITRSTRCTSS